MRPGLIAVIALVAAAVGGAASLVAAKATGVVDDEPGRTVFVTQPGSGQPETAAVVDPASPLSDKEFQPARIYAARFAGVVTIHSFYPPQGDSQGGAGQGSGFVVSKSGYVLTNSHVITTAGEDDKPRPASELFVEFQDGDKVPARIVGWDVFDDIGLVRVDPKDHALAPVPLGDSSTVVVGAPVAAIGSPFGQQSSLSVGVVSATRRSIPSLTSGFRLIDAIQIDAPINHGNSGGPLFDAKGRVVGINAQIRSGGNGQSATGGFEGVGFAVPINSAKRSMQQLIAAGDVAYAYVGIIAQDLTPAIARRFDYSVQRGAVIERVCNGEAGAAAGLRPGSTRREFAGTPYVTGGDVILAIDGRAVRGADDVVRLVSQRYLPGQVAQFTILRDRKHLVVPVRMGERPARVQEDC